MLQTRLFVVTYRVHRGYKSCTKGYYAVYQGVTDNLWLHKGYKGVTYRVRRRHKCSPGSHGYLKKGICMEMVITGYIKVI